MRTNILLEFTLSLADIVRQNWEPDIDPNASLLIYREVKSWLEPEVILMLLIATSYAATVKFRIII